MNYALLGARIRGERNQRGWTQEKLAEKSDISPSFLGHIERGTRKASLETLVALSNVLDISMDSLLSESLSHKASYLNPGSFPAQRQAALQEILRTVEQALSSWTDEK